MRLKNVPGSREAIADSKWCIQEEIQFKMAGHWRERFGNENPLFTEIGMGKGRFVIDNATTYPDINYVGVEKYSSVLIRGIQKMDELQLPNVLFMRMDAENITEAFAEGEVDGIYLNFSDPWPKDRHAKRRLPSRQFLARFDQILNKSGQIEFKTDNRELFDFAVEEVPFAGWKIEAITYDLHKDEIMSKGNIMTEYEEKFVTLGKPICKYIIRR